MANAYMASAVHRHDNTVAQAPVRADIREAIVAPSM
jgi:hypothetical protein